MITADMGPEFVSQEFQTMADRFDVVLHHIPVEAPWKNGLCERGGGSLKVIMAALIREHAIMDKQGMEFALAAALEAYNSDALGSSFSPAQMVLGKQPRTHAVVVEDSLRARLASHDLIESDASFARQVALRESARVAMVRLHYSQALRRAELSRARVSPTWDQFNTGDAVYFYRQQKQIRGKVRLRQWYGPAVLLALQGGRVPESAYVTYKGHVTKVAMEHLRHASTMEKLAVRWEDALHDVLRGLGAEPEDGGEDPGVPDARGDGGEASAGGGLPVVPEEGPLPGDPGFVEPGRPLPEVLPQPTVFPFPYPVGVSLPAGTPGVATPSSSSLQRRRTSSMRTVASTRAKVDERQPSGSQSVPAESVHESGQQSVPAASVRESGQQSVPVESAPVGEELPARGRTMAASASGRRSLSEGHLAREGAMEPPLKKVFEPLRLPDKDIEVLAAAAEEVHPQVHPLVSLQATVQQDVSDGQLETAEHTTWKGSWSLPSSSQWAMWEQCKVGLPTGEQTATEVFLAQNSKEIPWSQMSPEMQDEFRESALDQWSKWTDSDAIEVLSFDKSKRVLQDLQRRDEMSRVLQPRFALTDKNASLRTSGNEVPFKACSRLVVPGFKDYANLAGELRRDAPTGSRIAQHTLLSVAASRPGWRLCSADVRAAFLKGDAYVSRELYIKGADTRRYSDSWRVLSACAKRGFRTC